MSIRSCSAESCSLAYGGAPTGIIGPIHSHPDAVRQAVDHVALHRVEGILGPRLAVEKVAVVGVNGHTGGKFQLQRPPGFGDTKLRLEKPAVGPEVHEPIGVVLAEGH